MKQLCRRAHSVVPQYSCHGLVWLVGWLAFVWLWDSPRLYEMQMNMLLGLVLDIVYVAVIKAATRRRRPTITEDLFTLGPDKFSFPSGHASRAFFILLFFTVLDPISFVFWPPLCAWAVSVALSRLLLYRHHILDISAGALLGVLEACVMSLLWLGPSASRWMMSWLSDENLPGSATQEELF